MIKTIRSINAIAQIIETTQARADLDQLLGIGSFSLDSVSHMLEQLDEEDHHAHGHSKHKHDNQHEHEHSNYSRAHSQHGHLSDAPTGVHCLRACVSLPLTPSHSRACSYAHTLCVCVCVCVCVRAYFPPTGLKWKDVGAEKPCYVELHHEALAQRLQHNLTLSHQEWHALGISNLTYDNYIRVGDTYFLPEAAHTLNHIDAHSHLQEYTHAQANNHGHAHSHDHDHDGANNKHKRSRHLSVNMIACTHTDRHTHTHIQYIHVRTYTCTHTHKHTYI